MILSDPNQQPLFKKNWVLGCPSCLWIEWS